MTILYINTVEFEMKLTKSYKKISFISFGLIKDIALQTIFIR